MESEVCYLSSSLGITNFLCVSEETVSEQKLFLALACCYIADKITAAVSAIFDSSESYESKSSSPSGTCISVVTYTQVPLSSWDAVE